MRDILGQPIPPGKRKYTGLSLRDAMLLIPAAEFTGWDMAVDAVLLEEIPRHERLTAWKGESLDTGILFFTIPVSLLADS